MSEGLVDHHGLFDAGNNLDCAAAFTAGFDVYVENALQSLCLAHGHVAFGGCLFLRLIGRFGLVALAPPVEISSQPSQYVIDVKSTHEFWGTQLIQLDAQHADVKSNAGKYSPRNQSRTTQSKTKRKNNKAGSAKCQRDFSSNQAIVARQVSATDISGVNN